MDYKWWIIILSLLVGYLSLGTNSINRDHLICWYNACLWYFDPNLTVGQRISRVKKIQRQMKDQNEELTRIHFEMASFIDKSLLEELTTLVVPHADSLGMNEQELPNLHSMLHYGNVSFVSDSNPRTAVVLGTITRIVRLWNEIYNKKPFYGHINLTIYFKTSRSNARSL